jgi:hypothetical protein
VNRAALVIVGSLLLLLYGVGHENAEVGGAAIFFAWVAAVGGGLAAGVAARDRGK